MIIDKTYFTGKLSIPHLSTSEGVDASLSSLSDLERYIDIYEPKFLKELLGDAYSDYEENKTSEKWVAFENLLKSETKVSPIANYVFFYFYPDMIQSNTGVGTVRAAHENSIDVTDNRLVHVWNDMVNQLEDVFDYLSDTIFVGDYTFPDWSNLTSSINIYGI